MSGYRLFQALSRQIQLLTDHTLTLNSFLAPEEMKAALEPVPLDATGVVTGHFVRNVKNKPKECPQQRETKTVAKHAMSEVCLLPRPLYSRGRA